MSEHHIPSDLTPVVLLIAIRVKATYTFHTAWSFHGVVDKDYSFLVVISQHTFCSYILHTTKGQFLKLDYQS
jgi:hypothetical protein